MELILRRRHMGDAFGLPLNILDLSVTKCYYANNEVQTNFRCSPAIWVEPAHHALEDPTMVPTLAFGARLILKLECTVHIDFRLKIESQLECVSYFRWCWHHLFRTDESCRDILEGVKNGKLVPGKSQSVEKCAFCETHYRIEAHRRPGDNLGKIVVSAWSDFGGRGQKSEGPWFHHINMYKDTGRELKPDDDFFKGRSLESVYEEAKEQEHNWLTRKTRLAPVRHATTSAKEEDDVSQETTLISIHEDLVKHDRCRRLVQQERSANIRHETAVSNRGWREKRWAADFPASTQQVKDWKTTVFWLGYTPRVSPLACPPSFNS